jgi:hypothetical protein
MGIRVAYAISAHKKARPIGRASMRFNALPR